jgi:hypothetical protein
MRGDELIDERIDAALWSYAEPGEMPETGAAVARVLARVESAESRKRFWMWAAGIPAVACLLMVILVSMWWMRGSRVPEIAWVPKAPGSVAGLESRGIRGGETIAELPHPGRAKNGRDQNGAPGVLPKMDVFPTPRPLTAEERGLVAFASEASPELKKQVVEAERHMGDPITIAELKIAPLASGVVQDSKDPERDKEK